MGFPLLRLLSERLVVDGLFRSSGSGGVRLAGVDCGLGFLQVNRLGNQNLAVHGVAAGVSVVVAAHAELHADHIALVNQVIHGLAGAVLVDEGLKLDELAVLGHLAVIALGPEVVLGSDGELYLAGTVLVLESLGLTNQTAFSDTKIPHVNHSFFSFECFVFFYTDFSSVSIGLFYKQRHCRIFFNNSIGLGTSFYSLCHGARGIQHVGLDILHELIEFSIGHIRRVFCSKHVMLTEFSQCVLNLAETAVRSFCFDFKFWCKSGDCGLQVTCLYISRLSRDIIQVYRTTADIVDMCLDIFCMKTAYISTSQYRGHGVHEGVQLLFFVVRCLCHGVDNSQVHDIHAQHVQHDSVQSLVPGCVAEFLEAGEFFFVEHVSGLAGCDGLYDFTQDRLELFGYVDL